MGSEMSRRRDARERARERIIEGAMRVFSNYGFSKAPVHLIAMESGVSKGLIFCYFSSKDELVLEVAMRSLPADVLRECLDKTSGKELLECIGRRYIEKYRDDAMRNLLIYSMGISHNYPELEEALRETCDDLLREAARKAYGDDSPKSLVKMRMLFGSLLCYVLRRPEISEEEYLRNVLEVLEK